VAEGGVGWGKIDSKHALRKSVSVGRRWLA
jgi:hypothetical protein